MKGIMIQGTSSDVGKSLIATALCRAFANEGYRVAPFKSQNMCNYTYQTKSGKDIGRAQGLQAEAAKTTANQWMNPILLKPMAGCQSEVIMLGDHAEVVSGSSYQNDFYQKGLEAIRLSLLKLREEYELLVLEGAGSPVEINLKEKELANMKAAEMADVPVILAADIERGGVFASIIGTLELLSPQERNRVKGIMINKFHGDPELFEEGKRWIEEKTGLPVLAVLPYIGQHGIPVEDSLSDGPEAAHPDIVEDSKYDELSEAMLKHMDWEKLKEIVFSWRKQNEMA
ncbi:MULTISPECIES: cobyric acid synthase [unclassified Cytobacillus]|uniref:cobyric acid synthase n=1 Tax=unclassified Cytobacillus TaxID=2675268 RepID=UPI00203FA9FA|nr:cobyric acid synthase [Cytobacillus sp. AMY 15.2]MCM3092880.1 cobyric acid synthase [Cytobacillus sp. AMY 15.2]